MAFQAAPGVSLPHIATATAEMWPAMARVLKAPWQARSSVSTKRTEKKAAPRREESQEVVETVERTSLPEYMATIPMSSLRLRHPPASNLHSTPTTSSILAAVPEGSLRYASPFTRTFSSLSRTRFTPVTIGLNSHRTILGMSPAASAQTSRNVLAHMEQTANNNPSSSSAQNAFYQALLRANMPEIVVERYSSGRYAVDKNVESAYMRALERLGGQDSGGMRNSTQGQMTNEQLQAIGQAVSAKNHGGNVSISRAGSGAKNEPLYVVVDESMGSTIFKWVKFIVLFGFAAYCALVVFTLMIEATGVLKKVGGGQNAEAKPELQNTRFSDVHGCDEAKEELQELVEFLKAPDRFSTLGGKLPKGVLLVGPPGTGKTLLARAVAGEAGVPFFYMSGSEFDEVYVGVGAKRVRDLFQAARSKSPSIIFIDEIDAIGSKRHERDAAYAKQTLNQLLTELDGFDQNSGVIVIGATNFPQSLDKALTRPGRFDRNVVVPLPDVRGRIAILKHHMRNIRTDASVDTAVIARGCPGFSGAELENVVNQAAIRASKNKQLKVSLEDLQWAKDKIMMGAERRSAVIQQKDKVMTAYHEGGHALVAMLTEASQPLYKATIMPRGHALGLTMQLPELDRVSESKREMMAEIDVAMGGKVAEELVYGPENVTTGAASDINRATKVAYMMVTQAGMSDELGNIDLASDYRELSPQTKMKIESEVRRLVEEGRNRAMDLLTKNREGLDRLAKALVEYETLGRDEMEKVVRGETLPDKLKTDPEVNVKVPESTDLLPGAGIGGLGMPGIGSNGSPPAAVEEEGEGGGGGRLAGSP